MTRALLDVNVWLALVDPERTSGFMRGLSSGWPPRANILAV